MERNSLQETEEHNDRETTQGTVESNAVHNINDEKITITIVSGAAVSAMPKNMLPSVVQSENCENKFYRRAKRIQN